MARLPDIRDTLEGEEKEVVDEMASRRASRGSTLFGPYIPLLHHPHLASRIEQLGYYMKYEGVLPRPVYEAIILAVAEKAKMEFVWHEHVGPARKAGLPDHIIEGIARGKRALDAPYGAVLGAVDDVLSFRAIPGGLQQELEGMLGMKGVIELVAICGFYQVMGMVNTAFDVPLQEGKEPPFSAKQENAPL
jgi:4-carboxymuconolactone decarboxylase